MRPLTQSLLWRSFKRIAADPVRREIAQTCNRGRIPLAYCGIPNWGDALNPVLVELLSGRKVQHLNGFYNDRYMAIGSILEGANSRAEVWGSGFAKEGASVLQPPRVVHAVRGPLSRANLLNAGIECPQVYGDPALLLPRFFNPPATQRYEIGIIPHFIDKGHSWVEQYRDNPQIRIIDIESGTGSFVMAVKSCSVILSSCLHGLICADAYGIPNAWIKLSDILLGGNFKFRDYRLSINAEEPVPIDVRSDPSLDEVVSKANFHKLQIDLRKLLLACPFLHPQLRKEVESAPSRSCGVPEIFSSRLCDSARFNKLFA